MDIEKIVEKFKDRIPKPIDIKKEFAVLIPLIRKNDKWHVIYELRSQYITQPGEISFPGGRVEIGESHEEAAVRETVEELNIAEEKIEVLGELDFLVSYENITINCFLGLVSDVKLKDIKPNKDEVDHIFTVPLDFLMETDPDVYHLGMKTILSEKFPYNLIPNGREYNWRNGTRSIEFYHYNDYTIWGYTAKMTKQFIDILKGP